MAIASIGGVICCGNLSFDIPVWPVEEFNWGTTHWVERIEQNIGGNGGNTACTLAILGVPVRIYGSIGQDARGDIVLGELEKAGVDTGRVSRSTKPTNASICVVHPTGDRLFLHQLGASMDVAPDVLQFDDGSPFTHFHLANLFAVPVVRANAAEVLARAKAKGLTTSLDTGWDARGQWMADVRPCLEHTDLLFVNESEALHLTGHEDAQQIVGELRRHGATDVVVKLGGRGCAAFTRDSHYDAPAYPVQAMDTTGAGDCFAAGFLAALHRGRSYADAARFANAVGAMSVEHLGTVQGVRPFEETERWMDAVTARS